MDIDVRHFRLGSVAPPRVRKTRAVVTTDRTFAVVRTLGSYDPDWEVLLDEMVAALEPSGSLDARLLRLAAVEPNSTASGVAACALVAQVEARDGRPILSFAWWGDCVLFGVFKDAVVRLNAPHAAPLGASWIWSRAFGDRLGPARDIVDLGTFRRCLLLTGVHVAIPQAGLEEALRGPVDGLPEALQAHVAPTPDPGLDTEGVGILLDLRR